MELHVSLKIRTPLHLSQPHIDHYPPARLTSESLTLILDPAMSYTPGPELHLAVAPWPHCQKSYCIHIAVEHPRTTYVDPSYRRCHSEHLPSPPPSVLPGSSLSHILPFFHRRFDFINQGFELAGQAIYQFSLLRVCPDHLTNRPVLPDGLSRLRL